MVRQTFESDTTRHLDSIYYRYEAVPDTTDYSLLFLPVSRDSVEGISTLRLSGVKDFSFDLDQGFDQGLMVNLAGEVEGLKIEGNLSDRAAPSSTVPLAEIEQIKLNVYGRNFYGGLGDLTLELPFGVHDEIQGGRIGIHDEAIDNNLNMSYAVNRGSQRRSRFSGEEGKQSPYLLEGKVLVNSERVYLTRGAGRPILLAREEDYDIDYERGIISFTNKNIITRYTRIEVEYQLVTEDYANIYQETDGTFGNQWLRFKGMGRRVYDDKENPLAFTLSPDEIEGLRLSGDSIAVQHTYADTASGGSYILVDDHYVFVGQGNGTHDVSFFYAGEGNGEYSYDPDLKGFVYRGSGGGNYSPTKFIQPPQQEMFYALGAEFLNTFQFYGYASDLDKNTYSTIDDGDNRGKGGGVYAERKIGAFSVYGEYLYYDERLFLPQGKEDIDYQYQWNSNEPLKERGSLGLGFAPLDQLRLEVGYRRLNRDHRYRFIHLQPFFFQLGYEDIDGLGKYFLGLSKNIGRLSIDSRYENYQNTYLFDYKLRYLIGADYGIGISGTYDRDTTARGITTVFDIFSRPLSLTMGRRLYKDTTMLFGNAAVRIALCGISFNAILEQSQRYIQKMDELYERVDDGEGNYVYDSTTNTYLEKEGGDYIKKILLLEEFDRTLTRSYSIEGSYTKSIFDLMARFRYLDEENFLNHEEDILYTMGADIYTIEINMRQDITEDRRYSPSPITGRERSVSCSPTYRRALAHGELREELEESGGFKNEVRNSYLAEFAYGILQKPLFRPKIGYQYDKIFSQYFEDLDIRLYVPKVNILFGLPIKQNKGRLELTADLIYRFYNIEEVPYFFTAADPAGLTRIFGSTINFGLGGNTTFLFSYRIEFPPQEKFRQRFNFQTKIRF